jgi:hypothetical protein
MQKLTQRLRQKFTRASYYFFFASRRRTATSRIWFFMGWAGIPEKIWPGPWTLLPE